MDHGTSVPAADPSSDTLVMPALVEPPHRVRRPVMLQTWRDAGFLHWPYEPDAVQARLPEGLVVDTFAGSAWVGLIGFEMVGIRLPGLPAVPYFGTFPETNVRTYVRDADGRPGVWFHSLDATHAVPVAVARLGYRLPYMWSRMHIDRFPGAIRYRSVRRWPGSDRPRGDFTIFPDAEPARPTALDAFLTARWGLYSTDGKNGLRYAPVEHPAWPLHRASAAAVATDLVEAAGYETPATDPHVLWSPGVPVRVGLPRTIR